MFTVLPDGKGADVSSEESGKVAEAEAEPTEPEGQENAADSPPAGEQAPDKKIEPDKFQPRLDKLTKNWRTSERTVQERDETIAGLRKQLAEAPKERGKTLEDFEFDQAKFLDYRLDEVKKESLAEAERLMTQFQGRTEAQHAFGEFQERELEFSKKTEDYRMTVDPDSWACSTVMAAEIHQSTMGPEIAYHLAKNPDKAMDISRLPERDAVRRMAILEVTLKAEKAKTPKTVSEAPPPPPKVKGGAVGLEKDPAKMSDSEFAKWRRNQIENR